MTTDDLTNALAFAAADGHGGDLRTIFNQSKRACRTLAAEIERLNQMLRDTGYGQEAAEAAEGE